MGSRIGIVTDHRQALDDMEAVLTSLQCGGEVQLDLDNASLLLGDYCITARVPMDQLPTPLQTVKRDIDERRRRLQGGNLPEKEASGFHGLSISGLLGTLERSRREVMS